MRIWVNSRQSAFECQHYVNKWLTVFFNENVSKLGAIFSSVSQLWEYWLPVEGFGMLALMRLLICGSDIQGYRFAITMGYKIMDDFFFHFLYFLVPSNCEGFFLMKISFKISSIHRWFSFVIIVGNARAASRKVCNSSSSANSARLGNNS